MNYVELICEIEPKVPGKEIVMAGLSEIGFESFVEDSNTVKAYISEDLFDIKKVEFVLQTYKEFNVSFQHQIIIEKNWNSIWEDSYQPVRFLDKCIVRAPFHPVDEKVQYDIVIKPAMAFGTAHHETTSLIMKLMFDLNFVEKSVLDMGCGTGVLAILASFLGARNIIAIDNDEVACKSCVENLKLNRIEDCKVLFGDSNLLVGDFDVIIANINRNVLIGDMWKFAEISKKGTVILLSGFYSEDVCIIEKEAAKYSIKSIGVEIKNNWASIKLRKE